MLATDGFMGQEQTERMYNVSYDSIGFDTVHFYWQTDIECHMKHFLSSVYL